MKYRKFQYKAKELHIVMTCDNNQEHSKVAYAMRIEGLQTASFLQTKPCVYTMEVGNRKNSYRRNKKKVKQAIARLVSYCAIYADFEVYKVQF